MGKYYNGQHMIRAALLFVALVTAAIGSIGAPLITAVAEEYEVSLSASQWTLTIALLAGAVSAPLLGRLGNGRHRRKVVLAMLAIVVAGSVATVVEAPFAVLLIGRAAQGVGLGLTVLMMAIARQHLGDKAPSTIAMLSVASTVGVGVGYPLAGLLTQLGGVRAAYLLGLVVATAALVAAIVAIPRDDRDAPKAGPVDWAGAALLSIGLIAVLLVTSNAIRWTTHPVIAAAVLAAAVAVLAGWVAVERRVQRPLVDVRALRHPAVARANLIMLVAGIAMYLLFASITRYVQTPPTVGYGYGLTDFQAGLVLVPFSVLGFVAGRMAPQIGQRTGPFKLLAGSGVVVVAACGTFALTSAAGVAWPIVAMSLLGFAVGGLSAAMPQAILAVTPPEDTAAAMSVNQVVRSVGFSIGSAFGGLLLAAHTPSGQFAPTGTGYTTAAWTAAGLAAVAIAFGLHKR
ncbi:MFS transporter [Tenggerimyces flavus]|uniref:MFS transporter n=1 Tax=Tenggerimyces flavus TaxID=1708749 RepID=A0ABV7Y655_9ACTN|nr:MFS transporter [Tenggerimyces flavus]MBM7791277.1 putative MFS family arabinose efflux permease [Tenggerimyces flavus]